MLVDAVRNIPLSDKTNIFKIGDYGAADGAAFFVWIRDVIEVLKKQHGRGLQIEVVYEDQPINDFNSLFKRLSGIIPDPPSYVNDFENVFVLASGTSFYKRCVPSDSMHLIVSSIAIQYLTAQSPNYKGSIYKFAPEQTEESELLKHRAARDFELFLTLRSAELKEGGALVIVSLLRKDECLPGMRTDALLELLDLVWKSLKDEGLISSFELCNANALSYYRNLQEMKAPFENPRSQVIMSGLQLECLQSFTVSCPYYEVWKEKKEKSGVDDREEYARQLVSCHRNWSNGIFLKALSDDKSSSEKDTLLDEFFLRVQKTVLLHNPGEITHVGTFAYLCARKFSH